MAQSIGVRPIISESGPHTAHEINELEQKLRTMRESLTLLKRPMETLYVFMSALLVYTFRALRYVTLHPFVLFLLTPLILIWYIQEHIPGWYTDSINDLEFAVAFIVWWVGLGILSSIGLGFGLQSGLLFLLPHVVKSCLAAQACKTVDFSSFGDMWFHQSDELFKCPPLTSLSTPATFLTMWAKIFPMCFLLSAGSAIGEIPPFWFTRNARLIAIENGEVDELPEEMEGTSRYTLINRLKACMIRGIKQNGFMAVVLLASVPNLAFDLCGICCGHFLMPFWTFLLATFIGKAVIRNTYQTIFYVTICR